MSNTLKVSGPIRIGRLAADPVNPENGLIYYNTTTNEFRQYANATFTKIVDQNVINALTASQIAYARLDINKKNILSTSDVVESALTNLDDAIGDIAALATPTNYSTTSETEVAARLAGIDSALATAGVSEYSDSVFRVTGSIDATKKVAFEVDGLTTGITRTVTIPDTNVNLGDIAINTAKVSADGSVTSHNDVTSSGSGIIISAAERTKLNGIEALADVTDAINVAGAGAVMESDTSTALMNFVIDEDNMVSNLATKVPTQQSVKAFVSSQLTGSKSYQGGYDAATNTPNLDVTPIAGISSGDVYDVTVAGTFFTQAVEVGDSIRATVNAPTLESDWTIVQANLTAASIKTQYESNTNTNAYTDADVVKVGNLSGVNSGDEPAASTTVAGVIEIATSTEVNTGTDNVRAVSPSALANSQLATDVSANNAKVGYTAAQAKIDVVNNAITNGNLDTAPSENAVFNALALKMSNVVEDITPQLGGNLDVNNKAIEDAVNDIVIAGANSIKRAKQASKANFIEESYIHAVSLLASQTNAVIAEFTFAHASVEGMEIVYKIKEATSNDVRIGTLRVVTNGTSVVLNDVSTETADVGVSFNAVVNGTNINITYTSTANNKTMRADVKKFLA